MTRPQLIEANGKVKNNEIVDANTARQYLEGSQWIAKDAPFTRDELFATLMKMSLLTQATLKLMAPTLRALAFLGEEIDTTVAQEVATACRPAVSAAVTAGMEGLQDSVKELIGASAVASKAVENAREDVRTLEAQVRELKMVVEAAGAAAATAATEAQAAAKAVPTGPRTYTTAAATGMMAEQADVLARNARMR
jgi:hypothetical protein